MSNYLVPAHGPILTLEQGQQTMEYFQQNMDHVYYTWSRPDLTTYTSQQAHHMQDQLVPGFYWMPARDQIHKLFAHEPVTEYFLNHAGLQAIDHIDQLPPHSDDVRYINLIYNLCGLAQTVFYQDPDNNQYPNGYLYDENKIVAVEQHQLQLHQWYFLNTQAIHSVKNLRQQPRISITVSILEPFDNFEQACAELQNCLFKSNQ